MKSFKKIISKTSILFLALCLLIPGVNSFAAEEKKVVSISATTTFADLERMSNADMIDFLINDIVDANDDITDFWSFNSSAISFYSDSNRINALYDAVLEQSYRWTSSNDAGLTALINVLAQGLNTAWVTDDPSLDYLITNNGSADFANILASTLNNSNVSLGRSEVDHDLIRVIIDKFQFANPTTDFFYAVGDLYNDYMNNVDYYTDIAVIYSDEEALLNDSQDLYTEIISQLIQPIEYFQPGQSNAMDYMLEEMSSYLFNTNDHFQFASLTDTLLWYVEDVNWLFGNHQDRNFGHQTITDAHNAQSQWTWKRYYLEYFLHDIYGQDVYGNRVSDPTPDYMDRFLPEEYVFDDGEITIIAGGDISQEKIQRSYWAIKEVQSQFFRLAGTVSPVDGYGNPDDTLTAVVFNNRNEYQANLYFTHSTDGYYSRVSSGGIYYDFAGRFNSYDRVVPTDSALEFEELFRHEFTHYLAGKYLVPGLNGDTPLTDYDTDYFVWFSEGIAEHLAGATRVAVEGRETQFADIENPPLGRFFTVDEILHPDFEVADFFDYYDYYYSFFDFLTKFNNGEYRYVLDDFIEIITANVNETTRLQNFTNYVDDLSRDTAFNRDYQNHLDDILLAYQRGDYRTVLVPDDYVQNHVERSLSTIQNDITDEINLSNVNITTDNTSRFFDTFTLTGTYRGNGSNGQAADVNAMNTTINNALIDLENSNLWSGYSTVTAYFVDYTTVGGDYQFDVVFHGLYTGEDTTPPGNISPVAVATASLTTVNVGETVSFDGSGSSDNDGTIASYEWNFDDGSNPSTRQNPTHSFSAQGVYTVTLTVTDDQGATDTDTIVITVGDNPPPSGDEETEPNNRRSEANLIEGSINAHLDANTGDHTDWFTFDVSSSGDVTIDVTSTSPDYNVVVEDPSGTVVARPLRDATANLAAGTYYIIAYTWSGYPALDYTITVTGGGGGSTNNAPIALAESSTTTAEVGEQITFFGDGSTDSDGTIDSYEWNFNDGETSTSQNTRHTFTAAGTYNVTLTVTDNEGAIDTDTITITVGDTPPPSGAILEETGTLDSNNTGVSYYFTAEGNGTTTITLTASSVNDAITWVLYEADTGTRVDWASQNGNVHSNTMNLNPGTQYEISVYTWENSTIDYHIIVE
ncbi:PKD domain-containing protein [Chengkuizengella axinellae]|uniref:microbial collagenase n=1 Tax=Chengkuizengella axinellae TaxID=3064388 RepID=A0ABT9IUV6_9BACL|nr:PKD domain-containing protein [Chengkuizengella sp. 2205SS18-9]MDP5273144.1 PKD domain-containing protein [Chengkuizengella sp. 2205SS18-9]